MSSMIFALSQWGIISTIGHLKGMTAVGIYAFSLSLVLPVNMFFNFGVRQLISTEKKEVNIHNYIISVALAQILGLVLCVEFTRLFYHEYLGLVFLLYVLKIIDSLSETNYGYKQRMDDYISISKSKIIRSISLCISIYFSLLIGFELFEAVLVQVILAILIFVIYDLDKYKRSRFKILKSDLYFLGFPLALAATLLSIKTMIPRFLMEHYSTQYELGLFASLIYIVSAGGLVITSYSQVLVPMIAREKSKTRNKIIILGAIGSIVLAFVASLLIIILKNDLFKFIYGDDILVTSDKLIYLAIILCTTFLSSYLGYVASALRSLKQQPIIYICIIFSMFISYYISVYLTGDYVDSVYVTVIVGNILQMFLLTLLVRKSFYESCSYN